MNLRIFIRYNIYSHNLKVVRVFEGLRVGGDAEVAGTIPTAVQLLPVHKREYIPTMM